MRCAQPRRSRRRFPSLFNGMAGERSMASPKSETRNRNARASAFTITEIVIAVAITVLGAGAFMVFSESTGKTLLSLSTQSAQNQTVGNAVEQMIARIRLANTASVDVAGNTLTLGFDDDLTLDSDGDGFNWNDQDHFEQFQFVNADSNMATLGDNKIVYLTNTTSSTSFDVVPTSTRKLNGLPIFTLTNSTILINFGLLATNATPFSQQIEIRTKAMMRNRLK